MFLRVKSRATPSHGTHNQTERRVVDGRDRDRDRESVLSSSTNCLLLRSFLETKNTKPKPTTETNPYNGRQADNDRHTDRHTDRQTGVNASTKRSTDLGVIVGFLVFS